MDAFLFDYSENYWVRGYKCNPVIKAGTGRITGFRIWFTDAYTGIRADKSDADRSLKQLYAQVTGSTRYEILKDAYKDINQLVEYPSDSEANAMPYHTVVSGLLGKYDHKVYANATPDCFSWCARTKELPVFWCRGALRY